MLAVFALIISLQNPGFESPQLDKYGSPPHWTFFLITEPVQVALSDIAHSGSKSYSMSCGEKGIGFLHSEVFSVEGGKDYQFSVWVKGNGKARIEVLWWKEYNGSVAPTEEERPPRPPSAGEVAIPSEHLRDATPSTQCKEEWQPLTLKVKAPSDATKAYLRLVGEGGDVLFDDVEGKEEK